MTSPAQLSFPESRAVARGRDPQTSWEAAQSIGDLRESQQLVYQTILDVGPCHDEILVNELDGQMSPSGVRTRRKELCDAGLVKPTGEFETTKSGRRTHIWRAIEIKTGV